MRRGHSWFLIACGATLGPLCWLGFGSDNDIYTMLDAGRLTWHFHLAATSRNPGYWAYEAILFVLSQVGGFGLSNAASLGVGMVVIWRFLRIVERVEVSYPRTVAAALVVTPVFAIAATSSVDFVWSLAGVVLFAEMLVAEHWAWAVLAGAAAFALRGADAVVLAGAVVGAMSERGTSRWKVLGAGIGAASVGGAVYGESWRLAGHGFAFLRPLAGDAGMWSMGMRIGRFGYKATYLFGPVAVGLVAIQALQRRNPVSDPLAARCALNGSPSIQAYRVRMVPVCTGAVIGNALLFLIWPIELSYLLPAAFFGLLLLGRTVLARRRWVALAFTLSVLSLNVVTPRLAAPDVAGRAKGVRPKPTIEAGVLVEDVRLRRELRHCSDYDSYYRHFHQDERGHPL